MATLAGKEKYHRRRVVG